MEISTDKKIHFVGGFIAGLTSSIFGPWALLIVMALAFGKEWYDSRGYGEADVFDAMATCIGGSLSVIFIEVINHAF